MCFPLRAHWRNMANLCIPWPTRVHNPNGKSIGSAVFAQASAESAYTLQWARLCFDTAATSLTEVNQTLHDVWPSPGLVHYVYIFWGSCPLPEFCQVQNSLCVQVLRSPTLAALLHGTRAVGVSQTLRRGRRNRITKFSLLVIFNRGRHLHSERPLRWA